MMPVSEIHNLTYSTNYLYCSESQKDSINIFYEISDVNYHDIYDRNEEFISRVKTKRIIILKLDYFDSDKEYLLLSKPYFLSPFLYYINENEDIEREISSCNDFIILKNKDFISIHNGASLKRLKFYFELTYYSHPPEIEKKISFSFPDLFISHYEMIETSEKVIFFIILDQGALEKPLEVYLFDKKTLNFNKTTSISLELWGLTLINLNNTLDNDNFVYCISRYVEEPKCYPAKYKNQKIVSGNPIEVFSWTCLLPNDFEFGKNYALLDNQKIAIICVNSGNIFLTIFQYKNDKLALGNIVNVKIMDYPSYCKTLKPFLIYYWNKGLVIYNLVENKNNKTVAVYKSYIEESCSSFEIKANALIQTKINFSEHIIGGLNDSKPYFQITQIPIPKIILTSNNKLIIHGNTVYNSSNVFYFTAVDSLIPLVIKFKNIKSNYECNAIISIIQYQIEIKDKSYNCKIAPSRSFVNNITDIDLNKTYDINIKQKVDFTAEFTSSVEKEDLIYKYLNTQFRCSKYFFNDKKINCKLPINFDLFPSNLIKCEYNIYSNLSCLNSIYVGTVIFDDPYLIEIIDADNLTAISENFDKTYDASKKIEKFSVDMINYFYWFSSFGYCDDHYIESGECCREQILTNWEVISHKKYTYSYMFYLDMLGVDPNIDSIKKKLRKDLKMNVEDIDKFLRVYFYNYAILKSPKYKKYVFTFPGTTTFYQLFSEIILSEQVEFDGDPDIKVHELFYKIFDNIKNDIFSEEILKDIKSNKDYQIIFTGHSLGGAIANLVSYYYSKNNLAENEPVLITFGQPRVGNENFARDYMKYISNIYRIERYQDIVSILPPIKKIEDWESVKNIKAIIDFISSMKDMIDHIKTISELVVLINAPIAEFPVLLKEAVIKNFLEDLEGLIKEIKFKMILKRAFDKLNTLYPSGYCHIGGLYVINEENNKFYHCKDFYNQEIKSPYCKNWGLKVGMLHNIPKYFKNHHYLTIDQKPMERCQENKNMRWFL